MDGARITFKKFIKQCLGSFPPKYRLSRHYRKVRKFLSCAEWWDSEKIETWQLQKLQQIVKYAYENVPVYCSLYKQAGVKPTDIQSLHDIRLLPCVTKEMLRDNLSRFTSQATPKSRRVYVTTGGSTGIPVGFFHTRFNKDVEKAFIHSSWDRTGWKLNDISAVLRGAFVGSPEKFWQYDSYDRCLLLSSYYLTPATYDNYLEKIIKYKPCTLQAYPSVATIFADLILMSGDTEKIRFNNILLGSENLYPWQKAKISSAFPGSKIFSWYGHAEQVVLATMCEYSEQYHVWPFYGLAEICDENGYEVENGRTGELIGTSFWNYATPFIRYHTRDFAKKGLNRCIECNRNFSQLENIEGRLQEFIVTRDGRRISIAALNMHSDLFDNVKQFQFYQSTYGRVILKILPKEQYTEKDTRQIKSELVRKLGSDMELQLDFVEEIPRAPNGKYLFLKQELELKYGE